LSSTATEIVAKPFETTGVPGRNTAWMPPLAAIETRALSIFHSEGSTIGGEGIIVSEPSNGTAIGANVSTTRLLE
jgi:hypothetical protein